MHDRSSRNEFPDRRFRREVERRGEDLRSPLDRLRFVRSAVSTFDSAPKTLRRSRGRLAGRIVMARAIVESGRGQAAWSDRALALCYPAVAAAEGLIRAISPGRATMAALALTAVTGALFAPPMIERFLEEPTPQDPARPAALAPAPAPEVWMVESDADGELYSNGLRVQNDFMEHNKPRRYPFLPAGPGTDPQAALARPDWRTAPAGIVFHTTVSSTSPMLERQNNQLLRSHGEQLLRYIARERLYNFVIDRFGRVYRIVPEDEYAYHAGFSLWSDGAGLYVNLNESFLGVAFETRPEALEIGVGPEASVTAAQIDSARLLTRMLRKRYGIDERNCVTHEMVSLNPDRELVAYHTDWAGRFPFEAVGLPDNYATPIPAVSDWGFRYDGSLQTLLGGSVWPGLRSAQKAFRQEAAARGRAVEGHRRAVLRDYQALRVRLRSAMVAEPESARSH